MVRYPLTAAIALAAAGVSAGFWLEKLDIAPLVMGFAWWPWQPWRLITSTLPHGNFLHLLFNLYWLWVFGSLVEGRLGTLAFAGITALLAIESSSAEFAFMYGGIGLSGVGYGLFGLLWVLSRRDARFAGAVDQQTVMLFIAWFFICIVTTATRIMNIANIAHGVGAGIGVLLGLAITHPRWRVWSISALFGSAIIFLALAGPFRPGVNVVGDVAREYAHAGYKALERADYPAAAEYYHKALASVPKNADAWHNLAIACLHMNRQEEADAAFVKAWECGDSQMGPYLALSYARQAHRAMRAGKRAAAELLIREAYKYDPVTAKAFERELLAQPPPHVEDTPDTTAPPASSAIPPSSNPVPATP